MSVKVTEGYDEGRVGRESVAGGSTSSAHEAGVQHLDLLAMLHQLV